jgi:hypothetical protein
MEIQKSLLLTNGNDLKLSVPFFKINEEQRKVYGYATLDNVDHGDDVVTAEASYKAFSKFRGNVREMHQNIAVGKVVNFTQEPFYDQETQKMYQGIFVEVYVSKGAQPTWEKVLDGTLSAFSIGGQIIDADTVFDPDMQKTIRVVNEYGLSELSLVDAGMNPLSNFTTVLKVADGVASGIAVDVQTQGVYWCEADRKAFMSSGIKACSICGGSVTEIGWIEEQGVDGKAQSMMSLVEKYLAAESAVEKKGGVDMAKETVNEEVEAVVADTETVNADEVVESAVEEVVESEPEVEPEAEAEVPVEEPVEEVVAEATPDEPVAETVESPVLQEGFDFEAAFASLVSQVSALSENMASMSKVLQATADAVSKVSAVSEDLEDVKKSLESVSDKVEVVEKSTAVKKSADVADEQVMVKSKSIWGGRFFSVDSL